MKKPIPFCIYKYQLFIVVLKSEKRGLSKIFKNHIFVFSVILKIRRHFFSPYNFEHIFRHFVMQLACHRTRKRLSHVLFFFLRSTDEKRSQGKTEVGDNLFFVPKMFSFPAVLPSKIGLTS